MKLIKILLLLTSLGYAFDTNTSKILFFQNLSTHTKLIIYTPTEMLSFSIQKFLEKNAPHLLKFSETISHWSAYSTISPKVLIALIEYKTQLISNVTANEIEINDPFSNWSDEIGFSEQIKDIATQVSTLYYQEKNSNISASIIFSESTFNDTKDFLKIYMQFFPKSLTNTRHKTYTKKTTKSIDKLFQLPYLIGDSWYFGGSHTNTGSGSYPQSSLDFYGNTGGWGSDTSNTWIASSHGGRVVKHSSCFLEIIGANGWSTTYYHLDNIQVNTNQVISSNTAIANYANTLAQALCGGGFSTGPHLHFSLKYNGFAKDLNNIKLSGYTVHTGRYSYDTNCDYFWIMGDESKYCVGETLYNEGVNNIEIVEKPKKFVPIMIGDIIVIIPIKG